MLTNELLERLKVFGGNTFCVERHHVTVAELIGTILAERATLAQRDERIKELEAQLATAKRVGAAEELDRIADELSANDIGNWNDSTEPRIQGLDMISDYALRQRAAELRGEVEK